MYRPELTGVGISCKGREVWAAVIVGCRTYGGTEWIMLEQETYPDGKSPLECSAISFAALKKLLA